MPIWEYNVPNVEVSQSLKNVPAPYECIYCGSRGALTTEHVIPRGMGGNITIPRGSCEECQERILEFETDCMRKTLLKPRIASGLNRHPHEVPKVYPLTITDWADNKREAYVAADDYPLLWIMPVLEAPGILRELNPEGSSLGMLAIQEADDKDARFKKLLAMPGVKSVTIESDPIQLDLFARWLAKIAFGFTVACIGLPAVQNSEVRSLIRYGSSRYGYLVGGLNDLRLPSREYRLRREDFAIFSIALSDMVSGGRIWWVVRMRFFGRLCTPDYLVVLGHK